MNELENIIIDMIKEQQIKLGYVEETVRLYFPLSSLAALLGMNADNKDDFQNKIELSCAECSEHLGKVIVTNNDDRICIMVPPEGGRYVHERVETSQFLMDMINLFSNHNISIEDVCRVFEKYSTDYVCEKQDGTEFDYLLYFNDKQIDRYYFCIKFEGKHAIYHRFSKHDVQDILR